MHTSTFEVLADPTRRQIVEALRRGEQQVNDIVDAVDVHQSGVSRHLRILNEAGFVQVRPEGPKRLYSLRAEPFMEMEAWMAQFRSLWSARLDRFQRALERKQARRSSQRKETR